MFFKCIPFVIIWCFQNLYRERTHGVLKSIIECSAIEEKKYFKIQFPKVLSLFSLTFIGTNIFVKFIQCAPKIFSNILINYPNNLKPMGLWGKIISIFMAFYAKNLSVISLIQIQIVKSHYSWAYNTSIESTDEEEN